MFLRSPPIVYVRTGPRTVRSNGESGPAPAVPAEVLSWTARVKMPDGTERDVTPEDLESFAYHTATQTDPVRTEPRGSDGSYEETHPSYGTIQATHSSGYTNLFGCRVDSHHSITLRVTMGATVRVGPENSYSEGRRVVELRLSPSQFVALVAESANGQTVPCTITYADSSPGPGSVAPVPHRTRPKSEQLYQRLVDAGKEALAKAEAATQHLEEKLAGLKLSQKAQAEILRDATAIHRLVQDTIPFITTRIDEELHASADEAALNTEAAIALALKKVGLDAMAQNPTAFMRHIGASHQLTDSTVVDADSEETP